MKIKIHSFTGGYPIIQATELKIKNSLGFRFFIHKCYKDYWNVWGITEYSSGLSVGKGQTKDECIKILNDRLEKYNQKQWQKIIKENVKKHKLKYPVNN